MSEEFWGIVYWFKNFKLVFTYNYNRLEYQLLQAKGRILSVW